MCYSVKTSNILFSLTEIQSNSDDCLKVQQSQCLARILVRLTNTLKHVTVCVLLCCNCNVPMQTAINPLVGNKRIQITCTCTCMQYAYIKCFQVTFNYTSIIDFVFLALLASSSISCGTGVLASRRGYVLPDQ